MRIVVASCMFALMMQAAPGQNQPKASKISVFTIEVGRPLAEFAMCDFDKDGLTDAFFLTKTRPAWVLAARRLGPRQGFGPPLGCEVPEDCEGLVLQPEKGAATVLVLRRGGTSTLRFADFKALSGPAPPEAKAPVFLGFAGDLDGDETGDPMTPTQDGFEIALSKSGSRVQIRAPVTRARAAGTRGLLTERARLPLVTLDVLNQGDPPRPFFFAGDALFRLQGALEKGFGPAFDTILRVPRPRTETTLERTEARLVDVEGDGRRELLVLRTRTHGTALGQVRTELIFYPIAGAAGEPVPTQAILLPGVLSSGPDLKDVDGDGRVDLFLSVFGEDLGQQLTRRITGRVRLEYRLYRGMASGPPFSRSPDFLETDGVPEASFNDWARRHRLMLDEDWSSDRAPDLVQVAASDDAIRISVRPGRVEDGKFGFQAEPVSSAEAKTAVLDHRLWRLSASEPGVVCRTPTGAVIFAGAP
jgi:hypothetical protein